MSRILLFLSTGRCGTQFLTDALAHSAGDRAEVVHEPLEARYQPRQCLRMADPEVRLARLPEVAAHFDHWATHLDAGRAVIETGWPVFPWLPYLAQRFAGRLDIVHLTRDPVRFAFSMASHDYYSPRRDDSFTRCGALHPHDPGVQHREYLALWHDLNRVERSLFQWLEINTWAETLALQGLVRLLLKSEDLFDDPESALAALRGLHPEWARVLAGPLPPKRLVDRFHSRINEPVNGLRYTAAVAALAQRLGYGVDLERQRLPLVQRFFREQTERA